MTFREALQIQIKALQDIYDNAEALRNVAASEENKEAFNNVRRLLPNVWGPLQNLDNRIGDNMAAHPLKGNYSLHVDADNI